MDYDSHFLAPPSSKQPRKSPSRQTMGASLAHELAAAVMAEPTDSRALADELGIELEDEEEESGEEVKGQGLDTELGRHELRGMMGAHTYSAEHDIDTPSRPSRGSQLNGHVRTYSLGLDSDFEASPTKPPPPPSFALPAQSADPIETLKENVSFLEQFIFQLKNIDADFTPAKLSHSIKPSVHTNTEPSVERLATDMIRHIDDARREREVQLRDLINYEREFRKIDSEPGGPDRLGSLEPLEDVSLTDNTSAQAAYSSRQLDAVPEDDFDENWEARQRDPRDVFDDDGDGDDPMFALRSPLGSPYRKTTRRSSLPPPPPNPSGPLTPSGTLPHLAHMRAVSQVLAASLSGLSEHVQVNGAAAAEAGRKLRALKNKIVDLQAELTSAEESMERIEKSEKGLDWEKMETMDSQSGPETGKRIDGRVVVQEISASFFAKLQQADMKVQAMFQTVS